MKPGATSERADSQLLVANERPTRLRGKDMLDEGLNEQTIRHRHGRSSGIGLELAAICAQEGFDLWSRPIDRRFGRCRSLSLAGRRGHGRGSGSRDDGWRRRALGRGGGQAGDALLANAGHGLGRAFLDQDFDECVT